MNHSNWNSCIDFERNEIVFENRNKLFGAYVIRRDYSRNLLWSFIVTCLFLGTLLTPFLIKDLQNHPQIVEKFSDVITIKTFSPPSLEIITPPEKSQVKSFQKTDQLTNKTVVDRMVPPEIKMASGIVSGPLLPSDGREIITSSLSPAMTVIPDAPVENTPIKIAEVMPKFPGGDLKLLNYLSSNIKYTTKAKSNNIQGTVYLSFVVDTSGMITNIKLLQGIFEDCDMEAIKAVKNMPQWSPGIQNGNKVRVEMSLPVRFILK